jgi:hypothetical protein
MKTSRQEMLDKMLDSTSEDLYITLDWQGILDDLDANGVKDLDDLDSDTYYGILKDHAQAKSLDEIVAMIGKNVGDILRHDEEYM